MRSFKRILPELLSFFLCFSALCFGAAALYWGTAYHSHQDAALRRELAGSLDTLIVGASHALNGVDPQVLDEALGTSSYNLSGSLMPMHGRYVLLKKELGRNPVKTVYLEIAADTLLRNSGEEYAEGDEPIIARLDTLGERLAYATQYLDLEDWRNLASRVMLRSVQTLFKMARREDPVQAGRGFQPLEAHDVTASARMEPERYAIEELNPKTVSELEQTVSLCREKQVRVILLVVPESHVRLAKTRELDRFHQWMKQFALEHGCEYYNFNLLRDRWTRFSDAESFYDEGHLSAQGAQAFSEALRDWMRGDQVETRVFYESYDQALQDNPYSQESWEEET